MKRARALSVALALTATLLVCPPAASQSGAPIAEITLESQTPWVGRGGTFSVRITKPARAASAPEDLEYAVAVYPASTSRSAFTQTLTARPRTAPLAVITTGVTEAATDGANGVTLDVKIQDPALPRDRTQVGLRGAGVYPVSVDLRTIGGAVHARLFTHILFVPEPPTGPKLAVGVVVPLRLPLALRADGTDVLRRSDVAALASVATTLATLPAAGVLLAPSPESLAALTRSPRLSERNLLTALQSVARDHLVVAAPFVETETPAATEEIRQASAQRGQRIITEVFGSAPAAGVSVITEPRDDRLNTVLPSRLVVSDELLQPASQRVTPAEPISLRGPTSRTGVSALIADSGLAAHFDNDTSPALAAHHVLADLATIYFDSPGRFRSLAVNPAASWRANSQALAPLLAGLESSPILEAANPDRLFTLATPRTVARPRTLSAPPSAATLPVGYAALRRAVGSLRGVMVDAPVVAQGLTDRLMIAASASFDAGERRAYVRGLQDSVAQERRKFQLPRGGSVTLTARRGGIPITVRSEAGYDARVVVQLASDRLRFPGGATRTIELSLQNTTERFTVVSLGSGNVPLRVLLKSPDGELLLAESRLTLRSRNASGVGIALSAGALVFLLVWWYRHAAQRRRSSAVRGA